MATLPRDPHGTDLEDYVASHLVSRGAFVETGVTERDPKDILELDIVWTDYRQQSAPRLPIEIKSRPWHLEDIFKFYGWMTYLDLNHGYFVCRHMPVRIDAKSINKIAERIKITVVHIDDLKNLEERFAIFKLPAPSQKYLPEIWQFSFRVRRRLHKSLSLSIEKEHCPNTGKAAKDYFKLINDAVFFEPDVRTRIGLLAEAHRLHPYLAKSAAAEIAGEGTNFEDPPDTRVFKRTLFHGGHIPVQACLFLAHKARLAILKGAIDYAIAKSSGTLPEKAVDILGLKISLEDSALYTAFQKAVAKYSSAPNFRQYPTLWQVFLFCWGGFILEDRHDQEYAALSAQTGVPTNEIDNAFSFFESLFPLDGGWFTQPTGDSRKVLKLMPPAIRGIGSLMRLGLYGKKDYREFEYKNQTWGHMAEDHNSMVRILDCTDQELIA